MFTLIVWSYVCFTTNGRRWLHTLTPAPGMHSSTGIYCKRLYHRQLGARFVCDHYSLNARCAVGLRLPFPLFHVVPVLSTSYQDGVLRLCKADNSLVPPPGEDIRPDSPLLGQGRACNNEGLHLQVYLLLQKDRDNPVKSELKHTKRTFWITKSSSSTTVLIGKT